jgi:hypothetical protein
MMRSGKASRVKKIEKMIRKESGENDGKKERKSSLRFLNRTL